MSACFAARLPSVRNPITKELRAFETDDELYTCVDGNSPIEILATARSKVDNKDYPMAFVLRYGKGRVFHCLLGNDARAFGFDEVGELFRRGVVWAASQQLVPIDP